MRSALAILSAVNPLAVAVALWPGEARRTAAVAALVAWGVAIGCAASSDPVLDALDVNEGTFKVATAVVLGLASARWLVLGASAVGSETPATGWVRVAVPILFPVLVTPALVMTSFAAGLDDGVVLVAGVAAGALALAWLATIVPKRHHLAWGAGVRLIAALAMAVALALAVDGVKTV
jgi:hypothetical protein